MEETIFWRELEKIKKEMLEARDYKNEMMPLLEELQQLLYSNPEITKQYKNHVRINNEFESVYIIESAPVIDENIAYKDEMSSDEKANYLAQRIRQLLVDSEKNHRRIDYDLSMDNLRGECRNTTKLLLEECNELSVQALMRRGTSSPIIADGFDTKFDLGITENDNHSFGIVEIDGKKYIIDCTYRQFFSVSKNIDYGSVRDAGRYMLADEQRRSLSEQLLKYGFIEATPENLKMYLDGFVLADRKCKESDRTNITPEEYQKKIVDVNWERARNEDMSENPFFSSDADIYSEVLDSFETFDGIEVLTEEQKSNLERIKKDGIRSFGDLEEIQNVMSTLENVVENQIKSKSEEIIDVLCGGTYRLKEALVVLGNDPRKFKSNTREELEQLYISQIGLDEVINAQKIIKEQEKESDSKRNHRYENTLQAMRMQRGKEIVNSEEFRSLHTPDEKRKYIFSK